jgi:hypothetical protein
METQEKVRFDLTMALIARGTPVGDIPEAVTALEELILGCEVRSLPCDTGDKG